MQPLEHWTSQANLLARQLVDLSGHAIANHLMAALIHEAQMREPAELQTQGCENHWEEIRLVARYWGGPAPFDYQEVERNVARYFYEQLYDMPGHEQAWLYAGIFGLERLAADGLESFAETFRLERLELDSLVSALEEQLMTLADGGHVSEEFQPNEVDRLWASNVALESQLRYFKRAHQVLAESTAFEVMQRLVAQVCAETRQTPAFDLAGEGCSTHWDEICIMAHHGSDHPLFEALRSSLESAAWQAIKKLPTSERYALWIDTNEGRDWVKSCDGEVFSEDLFISESGLWDAARAVAGDVLSKALA